MQILNTESGGDPSSVASVALTLANRAPLRPCFGELTVSSTSQVASESRWYTWGQVTQWIYEACNQIERLQLPRGTHIASVLPNSADWFVLDFACQILGHVHVALDHRWPNVMVAKLLTLSHSKRFISSSFDPPKGCDAQRFEFKVSKSVALIQPADLKWLVERSQAVSSDSAALMLFTSGTSGEPKGVVLTHRNLVSNAIAKLDAAPQFETDLRLNILPFCHAYARTCELSAWVLSNSRLAITTDWSSFVRAAQMIRPTLVNLVPHLVSRLVSEAKQMDAPENIAAVLGGQVRLLQVGGAALPDALWYELASVGLPPLQGYGLTEASPVVCSNRAGQQCPGTIGRAVKGVELQVDSERQLWVRGPNVMQGYFGDAQATRERIRDGWLATGDLVEQDTDGHYRITGRISEVIVLSNGFKVSPELIETRLSVTKWIHQVMIVGQDRPYLTAVLWPAWEVLPADCFTESSQQRSSFNRAAFLAKLKSGFNDALRDLPKFMHPRRFIVQIETLEGDSELVNAKGGLRRGAVSEKLAQEIAALYLLDNKQDF